MQEIIDRINAARSFNKPYAKFLTEEDRKIAENFDVDAELEKALKYREIKRALAQCDGLTYGVKKRNEQDNQNTKPAE